MSPKNGSHIQFYDKHQVMQCARDLIERHVKRPESLKGIKFPDGLEIINRHITHFDFLVKYYGKEVGIVDLHSFGITYSE